jgi:membrane fusion protein (multidrug efflux system)
MAAGVSTTDVERERGLPRTQFAIAMAGVILLVALALLAPRLAYALTHETTDDAYVDAYPAVVTARVAGVAIAIPVHDGEAVRRGQILARLDDTEARAQMLSARQQLRSAEAALAQAQYEAAAAGTTHSAQAMRAGALEHQAGDITQSLVTNAKSSEAAAAATRQSIKEAAAALTAAEGQVPAAKTRLTNARSAYERMEGLLRSGLISLMQVESAQNEYAQAQAALQSALASVTQARANLAGMRARAQSDELQSVEARSSAQAQAWGETLAESEALGNSADTVAAKQAAVEAQQAQVAAARDALALAEYRLKQTVLRSPVDGYVASRPATIGQALQNGEPAVIVMPSSGMYVTANFKETQLERIRDGASADVHVDAFPHERFSGHVQTLGAAAQSALSIAPQTQVSGNFVKITQRVPVRVIIDGGPRAALAELRPGMSVEVSVAH